MANIQYVTKEGLEKLLSELDFMESIERPRITQLIADARDKGDLSENAEYDAAREAQGLLEIKIAKLKDQIANARIIDASLLSDSKVSILSTVSIKNQANGQKMTYTLVPETEANVAKGRISINTPIAKGLLGKEIGETAEITLPNGSVIKLEVLEIKLD